MITVCILTKNAASQLGNTLDSVSTFDEVILFDNGSTDNTLTLAQNYPNVRVITSPFIGFGPMRNAAAKLAKNDWILALDSDEVLSPPLIQEIKDLSLQKEKAYSLPRHNYYNKKRIRGAGWDHEYVARLYHREYAQYCPSQVHEKLLASEVIPLLEPILHTPYLSTSDFLAKMQHYSTLFAKQNRGKKRASFSSALSHAAYAFFRSYFLKKGFLCGAEGFIISLYNANTTFYKYLKLSEEKNSQT